MLCPITHNISCCSCLLLLLRMPSIMRMLETVTMMRRMARRTKRRMMRSPRGTKRRMMRSPRGHQRYLPHFVSRLSILRRWWISYYSTRNINKDKLSEKQVVTEGPIPCQEGQVGRMQCPTTSTKPQSRRQNRLRGLLLGQVVTEWPMSRQVERMQ